MPAVRILLLAATLSACASAQPESARAPSPMDGARAYIDADVGFMHGMLAHHAQALVMTELVPSRSAREEIRLLAERIDVSQQDEIGMMRRWLERRGEPMPDVQAHTRHAMVPGMLMPQELEQLAAATGDDFARLFLELMIRHHEGALVMVEQLFAAGGGQEPELFQLATHIDADQRAEIARMRRLLNTIGRGAP